MAKTYSLDDFASEPEQTFSLADFEGVPAAQSFSLQDFEEAAEPPGVFDRVRNFLTQPIPLTESEKLIAGSLKKGIKQLGDVPAATLYAELSGLQNAREAQYGKNLENAPPDVKARHAETAKKLAELQKEAVLSGVERKQIEAEFGVNPLAKKFSELSQSEQYKEADFFDKAKQYSDVLVENAGDIPGYIGTLGLESLPSNLAHVAIAMLTRFLPGGGSRAIAATTAGGTSGFIEFGNNYAEMRDQGMGHEEAWEKAAVKSGVIGLFDAVSFGAAGKAANEIVDKVQKGAALAATKQTLKSSTAQGLYGATGEGGGSAVIGEEPDPIKMGAEFAGEFFTAPVEAAGAYREYRQPTQTPPPVAPTTETVEPTPISTESTEAATIAAPTKIEPTYTVDPETGEMVPAAPTAEQVVEPAVEAPETPEAEIEQEAVRYAKTYNLPLDLATEVVRGQYERGELDVGTGRLPDVRAGADTGRIEPSVSMPSEGTIATTGVEPPRVGGLAGDIRPVDQPVSGEEAQRPALTEAEANLQAAEDAVNAATTPEEKQAAKQQRNKARQALKKVQAEAPVVEPTEIAAPTGFRYSLIESPAYEGVEPLSPEDADFELSVLLNRAEKGKLTPEVFAQSEIAKRLDTAQVMAVNAGLRVDPVATVNSLVQALQPTITPSAPAAPVTPTAPTLSQEDQSRLDTAKRDMVEAQGTLATLAEQGFTSPDQHYGVESAQRKVASAQEVINELEPTVEAPVAETPVVEAAPAKKRGRPAKPKAEGAVPIAPKRRGRPSLKEQLTPEQLAYKEAERQQNQEDLIKASRNVDKLIKIVRFVPQESKYRTPEEFEAAQVAAAAARKTAIYQLNKFVASPAFRSAKASGGKAAQFLASGEVTPKELADVQARIEFEKTRGPKPSAARRISKDKPVSQYYEFTRAPQAIEHIARTGTPFERTLAARLKPFLTDVRLAVAENQNETPDAIKDLIGDAAGVYSSAQFGDKVHRMIVLRGENFDDPDNQGVNNIIFLHEALHAATEAKIDEWQELTNLGMAVPEQLQNLINDLFIVMDAAQQHYEALKASGVPLSDNLRHKFEKLEITSDPKEFVAYGMTDPDIQQFLLQAPGTARKDSALGYIKDLFTGFVSAIRRAFNMDAKHQSALQDLMLVTEGILREQELEPAYSINTVLDAKVSKSDKALEKVQLSIQSSEAPKLLGEASEVRSFENYQNALQDNWAALSAGTKASLLIALPTADIIRWKGKEIPAFKDIDIATQRMAGMRQNLLEAYSKQVDVLGKFARKVGKQGMDTLATAMHLARLESVSPSLFADRADALTKDARIVSLNNEIANTAPNTNERLALDKKLAERRESINNVFNAWEALGEIENGQKMYKMVRQFYKDSAALTRALLDKNIASLNLEGDVNDPNTPKGTLMLSVRRMYEDSDFRGVDEYFPFMRHGEHVLEVQGPNGREVYFFDTAAQRNKFISRRAAQIGANKNDGDVFKAYRYHPTDTRDKFAAESRMLTDMFNAIEAATASATMDKEALKDELYQIYLTTLPEQSFRKRFMHADNVTGFSSDIFRNFKVSATQIAAQAAKLRYGPDMHASIQRAFDTLEGMPPLMQAELSPFVDEVARRAVDELVPQPDNKIAKGINQFAFYWLLTGVASAAVQTTALPMYVMPKLNTDYGYGKAAAKFAKWMNVYKSMGVTTEDADGIVSLTAPTMGESKLVRENPVLQQAFNEAKARNLFGQSFSNVISDRRRTPDNAYDNLPRVMIRGLANTMSGLFTGAERLTREAAYMMAFELEYAKSGDFDQAVNKATDIVQEFIGRFDSFARARIMRNPVGMVVGQFKPYAAIVSSFLIRNAYRAMKVTNPKEALASAHLLGSIILMGGLFHGVTGMPLYSTITALIDALLSGLDDEEEKRKRIAANPFTAGSSDLRFRYEFLPKYFGDIKIPGAGSADYPLSSILEKGPISVLTDLNFGSRTALDGIWFKTPKVGKDLQEDVKNWLEAFLPAGVSAASNIVKGITSINDGKIGQGMTELLPAFFANPVKATRAAQEGAKTKKGDVIVGKEELTDTNIAAQATGLQSTRVSQLQEQAFKLKSEELRARNERTVLLSKLDDVFINPEAKDSDRQKLINRIIQHNQRYPVEGVAIDPDVIFRSIDNTIKNKGLTFRGMQIKENMLPYILPIRMRLDEAVSRRK